MKRTAVITGDIINSEEGGGAWMELLKEHLAQRGKNPADWEIYRGDEFQIRTGEGEALSRAIHIKALIKSFQGLDVRMGIGLGEETFRGSRVLESNGTAYQRSGRSFETLKQQKLNLILSSGEEARDRPLNLMLKLALDFMDRWSPVSGEMVALVLARPKASQTELANFLNIKQSAVSQRLKRARMDLVEELLEYYTHLFNKQIP